MNKSKESIQNLTDEEVLHEFVKRFQCDGAILVYHDSSTEYGFGQWRNAAGRKWVNKLFKVLSQDALPNDISTSKGRRKALPLTLNH
jgi:hypothetical protein